MLVRVLLALSNAPLQVVKNMLPLESTAVSTVFLRFSAHCASHRLRAPVLERMLARSDGGSRLASWREAAFRRVAASGVGMPAVAAVALQRDWRPVDGPFGFLATPVHFIAGNRDVRLHPQGILKIEPDEAEGLAHDFNRDMGNASQHLCLGRSGQLICVFDQQCLAVTRDPEEALDRDIWEFLPKGADAPRVRLLMSEIEMWLFEHRVNRARAARGAPTLSGLWLWGGGPLISTLPALDGWVAGSDAFFGAFSARTAFAKTAGSGVIVLKDSPGTAEWQDIDTRWILPALAALRAGRISQLQISAADRCFSLSPLATWRVWRRTRPWWQYFE